MSQFYIMKAYHLTTSGRKLGLRKILRDEPNCTIVVATRHYGWGKSVPVFIIGCAGEYGVKAGDESSYTIDTGNGYRNQDECLDIVDVLQVVDGKIQDTDDDYDLCGFGNRYTYVMK